MAFTRGTSPTPGPSTSTSHLFLNPHYCSIDDNVELEEEEGATSTPSNNWLTASAFPTPPSSSTGDPAFTSSVEENVLCLVCAKEANVEPEEGVYKLVGNLLYHIRFNMRNLPETPTAYPFCIGCYNLLHRVWNASQVIDEAIKEIQSRAAEVAILQAGPVQVETETVGRIQLREAILEVYRGKSIFSRKLKKPVARASGRSLEANRVHGSRRGARNSDNIQNLGGDTLEEGGETTPLPLVNENGNSLPNLGQILRTQGKPVEMMDEDDEGTVDNALRPVEGQGEDTLSTRVPQLNLGGETTTALLVRPSQAITPQDGNEQPENVSPSPKLDVGSGARRKRRRKGTRNPYKIKRKSSSNLPVAERNKNGEFICSICKRTFLHIWNLARHNTSSPCEPLAHFKEQSPDNNDISNGNSAEVIVDEDLEEGEGK